MNKTHCNIYMCDIASYYNYYILFFCAFPFSVSLSIFFILVGELPYFILAHCNINVVVLSRNKI